MLGIPCLAQVPALSALQRLTLHNGMPKEGDSGEADFFAYTQRALLPMGMLLGKCVPVLLPRTCPCPAHGRITLLTCGRVTFLCDKRSQCSLYTALQTQSWVCACAKEGDPRAMSDLAQTNANYL
jgi:hypothetical protein